MSTHTSILTTTTALEEVVSRFSQRPFVAVDTEFMRETTYYPLLCLVQISDGIESFCIDPLAEMISLAPLFELMRNPQVEKIFHAGKQDMEIFVHLSGEVPFPVYDTQIAAMVVGLGEQVGYDKLVQQFCNVNLDKSSRFTNWAERPLSDRQISYALDDVIYLAQIYPKLCKQLEKSGRLDWVAADMAVFAEKDNYIVKPEETWRKLKPRNQKADFLNRLKYLSAWREKEAQKRNVPRGRILRDDTVMDLAGSNPKSEKQLDKIRGFPRNQNIHFKSGIIKQLELAAQSPLPPSSVGKNTSERPPQATMELLKVLLKHVSENAQVAPRLIATNDQLESLALGHNEDVGCLEGWRYELFGQFALKLTSGKLGLSIKDNKVKLSNLD